LPSLMKDFPMRTRSLAGKRSGRRSSPSFP